MTCGGTRHFVYILLFLGRMKARAGGKPVPPVDHKVNESPCRKKTRAPGRS